MNVNVQNTNTRTTATRSNTTNAFAKGRRKAERILFPKGEAPSWHQRLTALLTLIEGAGEQQRRGIADLLFGASFAILQIRDERVWRQLLDQLDASLGADQLLRSHMVRAILEADGHGAKLRVLADFDSVLTERQAQALTSRYGAKVAENKVAKALGKVRFAPRPDRRRGAAKPKPFPMGKVWNGLCDALPGVEVAAIDRALARIARGDQTRKLPARAAQLVAFRREAEAKRRQALKNLAK